MVIDRTLQWKLDLAGSNDLVTTILEVVVCIIIIGVIWFTESHLEKLYRDNSYGV